MNSRTAHPGRAAGGSTPASAPRPLRPVPQPTRKQQRGVPAHKALSEDEDDGLLPQGALLLREDNAGGAGFAGPGFVDRGSDDDGGAQQGNEDLQEEATGFTLMLRNVERLLRGRQVVHDALDELDEEERPTSRVARAAQSAAKKRSADAAALQDISVQLLALVSSVETEGERGAHLVISALARLTTTRHDKKNKGSD